MLGLKSSRRRYSCISRTNTQKASSSGICGGAGRGVRECGQALGVGGRLLLFQYSAGLSLLQLDFLSADCVGCLDSHNEPLVNIVTLVY